MIVFKFLSLPCIALVLIPFCLKIKYLEVINCNVLTLTIWSQCVFTHLRVDVVVVIEHMFIFSTRQHIFSLYFVLLLASVFPTPNDATTAKIYGPRTGLSSPVCWTWWWAGSKTNSAFTCAATTATTTTTA